MLWLARLDQRQVEFRQPGLHTSLAPRSLIETGWISINSFAVSPRVLSEVITVIGSFLRHHREEEAVTKTSIVPLLYREQLLRILLFLFYSQPLLTIYHRHDSTPRHWDFEMLGQQSSAASVDLSFESLHISRTVPVITDSLRATCHRRHPPLLWRSVFLAKISWPSHPSRLV
jgi:hypothetical protein